MRHIRVRCTYVGIRHIHSTVKPAITDSGAQHPQSASAVPQLRSYVHAKSQIKMLRLHGLLETKQDGSDRDAEVKYIIAIDSIDLLAAPLQHLTIDRQRRLASETTDECYCRNMLISEKRFS